MYDEMPRALKISYGHCPAFPGGLSFHLQIQTPVLCEVAVLCGIPYIKNQIDLF